MELENLKEAPVNLSLVGDVGPACHITTIADLAPRPLPALSLPEFRFSEKRLRPMLASSPPAGQPAPQGPMVPPTISNPRKLHEPQVLDQREVEWLNLRPLSTKKAPLKQTGFVAPLGALEGIEHLLARIATIERLASQQARDDATNRLLIEQDKELPTIVDEFRANGFQAISLSSSNDDDDKDPSNIATTRQSGWAPYDPAPEELAPILRRIEWEKNETKNGPAVTIAIVPAGDELGAKATAPWMEKMLTREEYIALATRLLTENKYSIDELTAERTRCEFYGVRGAILHGIPRSMRAPNLEQSMDELGAEDLAEPEEVLQGAQELGLHGGLNDRTMTVWLPDGSALLGCAHKTVSGFASSEPSELALWPLEEHEK